MNDSTSKQIIQPYVVPAPSMLDDYYYHDAALYSMWNHFVEFCQQNSKGQYNSDSNEPTNLYTGGSRLNVFINLSNLTEPTLAEPAKPSSPQFYSLEYFNY